MRIGLTLAGALALLAGGACGSDEPPQTPVACLAPAPAYLRALEAAPGEVLLDGSTPISSCIVAEQESGALQSVGTSAVGAATELNREILRLLDEPRGAGAAEIERRTVELGYLVGALAEGAEASGDTYDDLMLRLDSAARYGGRDGGPFPARLEPSFGRGYAAGRESG